MLIECRGKKIHWAMFLSYNLRLWLGTGQVFLNYYIMQDGHLLAELYL
ncbi:hypothetical protein [Desulfosporosinus lacus]|nr:hypothetical protein [Desulfosporosinus lacus]